jgi:hypothetical protein
MAPESTVAIISGIVGIILQEQQRRSYLQIEVLGRPGGYSVSGCSTAVGKEPHTDHIHR